MVMVEEVKNKRKKRIGTVITNKMNKTVVVEVERKFRHPIFQKIVKQTKRFKVHDEKMECKVGDVVRIMEVRPLSKEKRWKLMDIIKRVAKAED